MFGESGVAAEFNSTDDSEEMPVGSKPSAFRAHGRRSMRLLAANVSPFNAHPTSSSLNLKRLIPVPGLSWNDSARFLLDRLGPGVFSQSPKVGRGIWVEPPVEGML